MKTVKVLRLTEQMVKVPEDQSHVTIQDKVMPDYVLTDDLEIIQDEHGNLIAMDNELNLLITRVIKNA